MLAPFRFWVGCGMNDRPCGGQITPGYPLTSFLRIQTIPIPAASQLEKSGAGVCQSWERRRPGGELEFMLIEFSCAPELA